MKAVPQDYRTFESWLRTLAHFGNGQTPEAAQVAQEVLSQFESAKAGLIGRRCVCGKTGTAVLKVQPVAAWPYEEYVFCHEHATLIGAYQALMKRLVDESKGE